MHNPENAPVRLLSAANDLEAAMVVSALAAHEVDATTSGGFTAGFRAEAPGDVEVLVRSRDLEKAREILSELESEQHEDLTPPEEFSTAETGPPVATNFTSFIWWFLIALCAVWLIYRRG